MGRFHRHDDGTEHTHDGMERAHGHPSDGQPHAGLTPDRHGAEQGDPHGDLSAYETGLERVSVLTRIFDENDRAGAANRALLDAHGVRCVNFMSSPGAGKTTLLARALRELRDRGVRVGVVEGDIETSLDADRLEGLGAQVVLLNTGDGFGGECHLDAPMVAQALSRLDLDALDLVVVENVGNLVCPAEFDVGAHDRTMVYAITEGEEKPLKYPVMFRAVSTVVVNKMDLLPHLDLDLDLLRRNVAQVNPAARVIEVSARTGDGLTAWYDDLTAHVSPVRSPLGPPADSSVGAPASTDATVAASGTS